MYEATIGKVLERQNNGNGVKIKGQESKGKRLKDEA